MNSCKPFFFPLLLLILTSCQSSRSVQDTPPAQGSAEDSAQTHEFIEPVSSGARWSAALEASDDPRTVYVLDQNTDWVYAIGGDARVTIERLEWLDDDELEIHGGGYSVILHILPPEPDTAGEAPRFVVMPPGIRDADEAGASAQGRSSTTYGPAPSGGTGGGSLTLGTIYTMKDRLKRESYQQRGPRVPSNN
jgi:hypothetical protein